jgi:queuine tRNA-ribosyltransferase subunit QTRTD1
VPAIFETKPENGESPLRTFASHAEETVLILGPRRVPPVETPTSHATNHAVSICTSVGFRYLKVQEYISAAVELKPDICVALADILHDRKPSSKRAEKMVDRTAVWLRDVLDAKEMCKDKGSDITVFAAILPIPSEQQSFYTNQLVEDFQEQISGLVVYDAHSLDAVDGSLAKLPILALTEPVNPRQLLREILLGIDLVVLPFINVATDAGIALDFVFPPPRADDGSSLQKPLGLNTWDPAHATDLSPLRADCQCYTCQNHHRAYLQHLLSAKEMLAWVLLQLHNHHIMDCFFAGVRASITNGGFEKDKEAFEIYYESEFSEKTNAGPRYVFLLFEYLFTFTHISCRLRGYQFKSMGGGEPKKNKKGYNKLDGMAAEAVAEAEVPSPSVGAMELEEHGFGKVEKS